MALTQINVGTVDNDGTGQTIKSAFQTVNANNLLFGTVTKTNVTTTDPVVGSDGTAGYAIGSQWYNSTVPGVWRARTVGTGAAVWDKQGFSGHPGYIAAQWALPFPCALAAGNAFVTTNARFIPFIPENPLTISDLGARVSTLSAAGNFHLAIYASHATTKKPTGSELGKTASTLSTGTATFVSATMGGNVVLQAGVLYWLGINCDNSVAQFYVPSAATAQMSWVVGATTGLNAINSTPLTSYQTVLTYGTWGDLTAASWTESANTAYAMITVKVVSVP